MKKMLWMSSVLMIISTSAMAQESFRSQIMQPNAASASGSPAPTYLIENNTEALQIPENTSLNQGAYVAVPLDAPLQPIGGGANTENGGMNLNGSRITGIGR